MGHIACRRGRAMKCNKVSSKSACSGDADLLAKNSPHSQLKTVPAAGCAQAGPPRHQGCKQRVAGEMGINGFNVCADIKQAPHSGHNRRERSHIGKTNCNAETLSARQVFHFNTSGNAAYFNSPQITPVLNNLNARDGTRLKIAEHGGPVVRRPISQLQCYACAGGTGRTFSPQCAGRTTEKLVECFIEPPHAAESSRQCNFGHRHSSFVNKLLGKKHTPRLRDRDGGGAEMLLKQTPEVAFAQTKAFRQCFYACARAIESAVSD